MENNKTGKYIKYAIGEILLVVIGILIALQINNWNQEYQNKKVANLYITDLIREVTIDITALNNRIKTNENMVINIDSIFMTIAIKKELSKNELISFFKRHELLTIESYFIPEKSTFRQVESSSNGRLIPNKTLRDKLYQYYSFNERNEKNGEISIQLYQHSFFTRFLTKDIMGGNVLAALYGTSLNRPDLDLKTLKQNSDYLWALGAKRSSTLNQNGKYQEIKTLAENLLELLESESKN